MHTQTSGSNASEKASSGMQECIGNCIECYQACTTTIRKCLSLGGRHASPEHITLLLSCAKICNTSAEVMMLGTDAHTVACKACGELCAMCADECESMGDEMKDCAESCRRCQQSCEQMSSH